MDLAARILADLPAAALEAEPGVRGIVRVMRTHEGRLVDARITPGSPPRVELGSPPEDDPERLARWLALVGRRRGQLAHDLSGPATGVLAALETVLEFERVPDSTRTLLEDARSGMLRLNRILDARDALLSPRVNALEGPLDQLLERWVRNAVVAIDPEEDRFVVRLEAPSTHVRLDAGLIEGALWTLLKNAWSFRQGQRTSAIVRGSVAPDHIGLEIEDEGRGLDEEELARAGDLGFTTRASGVGLGLFALRWAVRDRGAVRLDALAAGCRARLFLSSNTVG